MILAWGACVDADFRAALVPLAGRLKLGPNYLMACMAFETGETFSPSVRNAAGSGAVGLIQFMPQTAYLLGTTVEALAAMTAVEQLAYVEKYFRPWTGKLATLGDVYGAILWPAMIGKPDGAVVFDRDDPRHPKLYLQNRGLDLDGDGKITRSEVVRRVGRELERGLLAENAFNFNEGDLIA